MKKGLFGLIGLFSLHLWAFPAFGGAPHLFEIHGSNTVGARLAPVLVEAYLQDQGCQQVEISQQSTNYETLVTCLSSSPTTSIRIVSKGSSTGFDALNNNEAQIVASSRKIREQEVAALANYGDLSAPESEHVIALNAVNIIVNNTNPLNALTLSDTAKLFKGLYGNWTRLEGSNQTVTIMARDKKSGTRTVFENVVMGSGNPIYYQHKSFTSNDELSKAVANNKGAVGFVGFSNNPRNKVLALSITKDRQIKPDQASILTEDYPLSNRLYFYMPADTSNEEARRFYQFIKSSDHSKLVTDAGFIPATINTIPVSYEGLSTRYKRATVGYQRLSTNIRFSPSGKVIDNFGLQSIEKIVEFMENNNGSLLLIGFYGLSEGNRSREFSAVKAKQVSAALVKAGISRSRILVRGLGSRHLLSPGRTKQDDMRNIRVEAWFKPWFSK
ncbi:substrate-binding domain-containing protein [Parendozoicomonas haliclonae]|nr:substrate-binding domain-containing protein [Parendozoicomonas haliclonae]